MMAYIALYRKWRPGSFKDLVGQEHIERTLSNAITSEDALVMHICLPVPGHRY